MREEAISGLPGLADRGREAREESDRTAGTEKVAKKAPEKAGHPWQGSPQVREETGAEAPSVGRTQNITGRSDDAERPGRLTAKTEKGAGAFSARARQRAAKAADGPAGEETRPHPKDAFEDGAAVMGRKAWRRLVRMHGGRSRMQEG